MESIKARLSGITLSRPQQQQHSNNNSNNNNINNNNNNNKIATTIASRYFDGEERQNISGFVGRRVPIFMNRFLKHVGGEQGRGLEGMLQTASILEVNYSHSVIFFIAFITICTICRRRSHIERLQQGKVHCQETFPSKANRSS